MLYHHHGELMPVLGQGVARHHAVKCLGRTAGTELRTGDRANLRRLYFLESDGSEERPGCGRIDRVDSDSVKHCPAARVGIGRQLGQLDYHTVVVDREDRLAVADQPVDRIAHGQTHASQRGRRAGDVGDGQ